MIKNFAIPVAGIALFVSFTACNSDIPEPEEITYSSTMVKSFSLKANAKILNNLDSVFFSIDHINATIFNADSLPFGTDVSRMLVNLTTDACSTIELNVPQSDGEMKTINYMTNSTDSIDFSAGAVTLHLVSYDGLATRDYDIRVNVHKVVPDSLYWDRMSCRQLPSILSNPTQQKSVKAGSIACCLTAGAGKYSMATSDTPGSSSWNVAEVNFGFTPQVESLAAAGTDLFILSEDGGLYRSSDLGGSWNATGQQWSYIYGAYSDRLLGVANSNGTYTHVTYPPTFTTPVRDDCPVEMTSTLAEITSKWSDNPQVIFVGGRTSDGTLSNQVWGYDGSTWACLSDKFPVRNSGMALFSYTIAKTDTVTWRTTSYPVMIAMEGLTENGLKKDVYVSRDNGLTWKLGDDLVQLPSYIPAMTCAQPLIFDYEYTSRSSSPEWVYYSSKPLPGWWSIDTLSGASRAATPVTQWECPYIYLFGGEANGHLYDTIWKGVIHRLTFKPLQ